MQKKHYINQTFSIIYHNEDVVEFRSGAWNVVTHMLNDDSKMGNLAKIILEIDEGGITNLEKLSKNTGISKKEVTAHAPLQQISPESAI